MSQATVLRTRELAQIHIAKKQLGLDDDTYRDMLWTVARVRSAGDLDYTGRKQVLAHLKARGFKVGHKPGKKTDWGWIDRAAEDRQPMLRKIAAMLREAGRGKNYADALAKKMCHVERIEFCAADQLHAITSALVYDQKRRAARRDESRVTNHEPPI